MRAKKIVCFFIVLLLSSAFMFTVDASPDTTATFRGGGVTIDLTFPEEAHPNATITHNVTIISSTMATLRNFTVVIRAPVNSNWQEIVSGQDLISKQLPVSYSLQVPLPQEAHGTLQCFIFVNTSSIDDLSITFYTTLVSEPTFSEMFANYTILQANYTTLLNEYNDLLANYSSLFANYTELLSQYNALSDNYTTQVAAYASLLAQYNTRSEDYATLNAKYSALQSDYDDVNSTRNSLQANYTNLQANYNSLRVDCNDLNQTYNNLRTDLDNLRANSESALNNDRIVMFIFVIALVSLIAFIIYLRRGKEEPYVVIRKETVSMNQDENS
jgi:hypothetical protein